MCPVAGNTFHQREECKKAFIYKGTSLEMSWNCERILLDQ